MQNSVMLDSERGDLGVRDEVPGGADSFQQLEDVLRVSRAWLEHLRCGLAQPGTNMCNRFRAGQRILKGPRIGPDAHKPEQYHVQKPNRLGPG